MHRRRALYRLCSSRIRAGVHSSLGSVVCMFILVQVLSGAPGCADPHRCPPGENLICRDQNDCRCGRICRSMDDCTGRDVCARFRNDPTGPGVCVDVLWLYDNPPCVPLCRPNQVCVRWSDGRPNSCQDLCTRSTDCSSRCCVPLTDGQSVCAPAQLCQNTCIPPCNSEELCVLLSNTPVCARRCTGDSDCEPTCCLPLEGGGGACSPNGTFCPTMPRPPCRTLETCMHTKVAFNPAPTAACGMYGSYEASLGNNCTEPAWCRACWWSAVTGSYSDCVPIGQVPSGATVPIDVARCADTPFPDPPVRVRCIDETSFRSSFDCLGTGQL